MKVLLLYILVTGVSVVMLMGVIVACVFWGDKETLGIIDDEEIDSDEI